MYHVYRVLCLHLCLSYFRFLVSERKRVYNFCFGVLRTFQYNNFWCIIFNVYGFPARADSIGFAFLDVLGSLDVKIVGGLVQDEYLVPDLNLYSQTGL